MPTEHCKKILVIITLLATRSISCMQEEQSIKQPSQETVEPLLYPNHPITDWPAYLYDNASPGIGTGYSLGNSFDEFLKDALTFTKAQAQQRGFSRIIKREYDWAFALKISEITLLKKPFIDWTIEDIISLALMLTRSSAEKPGKIRTQERSWRFVNLARATLKKLRFIEQQGGPRTEAELAFCNKFVYCCPQPCQPHPFDLKSQLDFALYTTIMLLKKAPSELAQRRAVAIECAAFLFFEINRIQPFEHGNGRLSRIVAHFIFAQNGIKPLFFDKRVPYDLAVCKQLIEDIPVSGPHFPVEDYFCTLLTEKEEFIKRFRDKLSLNKKETTLSKERSHQLLKALAQEAELLCSNFCAMCNRERSDNQHLLFCGRCKTRAYCSKACQKQHWPTHKKECNDTKSA